MGRYSSVEWAGKVVRQTAVFILSVTDQAWDYSSMNEWRSTAGVIENLGIKPLVSAYNSVAKVHELPEYALGTDVKGLLGSRVSGKDQEFVRKEADFIATTFDNAMLYMATNEGWSDAQKQMELVALERLGNMIRFVRCISSSDEKAELEDSKSKVAA